jgi:hypothetical protein
LHGTVVADRTGITDTTPAGTPRNAQLPSAPVVAVTPAADTFAFAIGFCVAASATLHETVTA